LLRAGQDSPRSTSKALLTEASAPAAAGQPNSITITPEEVVRVSIAVSHSVGWGDRLAVVGQDQVLGSWQPGQSVALSWSEGDIWRAEVVLPPGVHEFKVRPGHRHPS
jgi:ABC-type uncharacterized transport system auxiliary subunit